MSHDKATPRPWYVSDRDDRAVILMEGADYEIAQVDDGPDDGSKLERAERIVEAVNSHDALKAQNAELKKALKEALKERDALVEALSKLYGHLLDEVDITNSGGPNQAMRLTTEHGPRVEAALVKAGGK